jgi:hypothetical protein
MGLVIQHLKFKIQHIAYSVLKLFTGLAMAARMAL